ncbi:DUF4430 domain-containing protein [Patescibacteria group bacterium]|nr:DUF4430 domain-containing protein [Patescibacteria group bacterium]
MKKNLYIIIGAVAVIIIGGWLLFSDNSWQSSVEESSSVPETTGEVTLVINDGGGDPRVVVSEFEEGVTVFDLLKNETEKLSLNLKTKTYDIGILVEAIGDKENGQDNNYWLYYVNGEMPMVSADKTVLKFGDMVEFKFEKSTF